MTLSDDAQRYQPISGRRIAHMARGDLRKNRGNDAADSDLGLRTRWMCLERTLMQDWR